MARRFDQRQETACGVESLEDGLSWRWQTGRPYDRQSQSIVAGQTELRLMCADTNHTSIAGQGFARSHSCFKCAMNASCTAVHSQSLRTV